MGLLRIPELLVKYSVESRVFQCGYYRHFGLEHSLLSCPMHPRMSSTILSLTGCQQACPPPQPGYDNQECLQTWPNVPWGIKSPHLRSTMWEGLTAAWIQTPAHGAILFLNRLWAPRRLRPHLIRPWAPSACLVSPYPAWCRICGGSVEWSPNERTETPSLPLPRGMQSSL